MDEFDMAYRAMVTAPLGWAIMKINKDEDTYADEGEYATILKTYNATRQTEKKRTNVRSSFLRLPSS